MQMQTQEWLACSYNLSIIMHGWYHYVTLFRFIRMLHGRQCYTKYFHVWSKSVNIPWNIASPTNYDIIIRIWMFKFLRPSIPCPRLYDTRLYPGHRQWAWMSETSSDADARRRSRRLPSALTIVRTAPCVFSFFFATRTHRRG
jgi:hypothetical protein